MSLPGNINQLLIGAAASAGGAAAGPIKSVRFDAGDTPYLDRTARESSGSVYKYTVSWWMKIASIGTDKTIVSFATNNAVDGWTKISIRTDNRLQIYGDSTGTALSIRPTMLFRDTNAWYHCVVSLDTTQSTYSDQAKFYINGVQQTDFTGTTAFAQNTALSIGDATTHHVGVEPDSVGSLRNYFDGYIADLYVVEGKVKEASDFGEFDANGVWRSKSVDASITKASITEGTGALSLYNLGQSLSAKASPASFRTDPYASNLQTAVAGDSSNEVSYLIRGSGSALTLTNTSVTFNQPGKYYNDGYLIQTAGAACEVAETSGNKPGTSDFCVEFWINPTVTPNNSGLFSYGDYNTAGSFGIMTTGSNSLRVDMHDGYSQTGSALTVAGGLQANEWQHFALTRAGTTCTLYRNGTSQGTWTINAAADFTPASNPRYVIGNRLGLPFGSYNITSYFQDFRVYVGTEKYSGNFTLTTQTNGNSFHLFDFANENGIGDDSSGNENNFTVNNLSSATGGPTSVAAATGGLPIHETTDTYGRTIGSGLRADANASYLELAAPFTTSGSNALTDDESPSGRTSSTKTLASSGTITSDSSDYHFYGSSASFGASAYYSTSDSAFNFGTGDFTIEFFVKQPSGDSGSLIATNTNSAATTSFNSRFYGSSGTIDVYTSGSLEYISIPGNTVDEWVHIAFVRSKGSTLKVFINGALKVTNNNWTMDLADSGNFYVNTGRDGQSARHWQDLRVYKGLAKYSSDFNPPTQTQDTETAVANDVLRDVPTNGSTDDDTGAGGELSANYATWNQLIVTTNNTLSQGNLKADHTASAGWSGNSQQANSAQFVSSIGVSSGLWYWEITVNSATASSSIGIVGLPGGHNYYTGYSVNGITEGWGWSSGGTIYHTSGITNDGGTLGNYALDGSSILGFALDMDNGRLYVSNNGVYENSGDPEAGTGYCASGMSGSFWFAASQLSAASATSFTVNTGQRKFAYDAPANYKCICTANLPESTIPDGSDYFTALTWTGDGTGSRSFTGLSFQPDFTWAKIRSLAYTHILFDAVRGAGSLKELQPNSTNQEGQASTNVSGYISAFNSDGFSSTAGSTDNDYFNRLNDTYVAWNWDAGNSNTSISAGSQNSSLYNQDQVWSTYGTHVGNYFNGIYTWDGVFSASMNYDQFGSLYVSSGTKAKWTLSSSLACNSEFKFYCYNNTTIILNEGLSSEVSSTSTGGGSFHYHTIAFSGNIESVKMDNYSSYLIRLYVDGKALIDSDVTAPDVPAIASTVRANPEAGFSIVSYTGTGTSGDTVEHGLNAVPEFILTKRRDSTGYWPVYHKQLTAGYALQLDATAAEFAGSQLYTNTAPTSSVFSVGDNAVINASGGTYISYCFTGVEGFSKFGTYTGNGNADGAFVFLGFKPALLIIKGQDFVSNWFIHDNKRPGYNVNTGPLRIAAEAELSVATYDLDILSNGFKMRTSGGDSNQNGKIFVYMAWASNPFQANGGVAR